MWKLRIPIHHGGHTVSITSTYGSGPTRSGPASGDDRRIGTTTTKGGQT
jgi:hypothetical protein